MQTPWIERRDGTVALPGAVVPLRGIELGGAGMDGVPRGAAAVFCPAAELDSHGMTVLNALVEHGYESVAVGVDDPRIDPAAVITVALERLAARSWDAEQVGVIGYGESGALLALHAAVLAGVGAAVSVLPRWTAGPGTLAAAAAGLAGEIGSPWLWLIGGPGDPQVAADVVTTSPAYTEVVSYPAGGQSFYLDSGRPEVHAAAWDSWQRTVEWLNLRVVPRPTLLALRWARRRHDEARVAGR